MRKLGILIIFATVGACAKRSADESQPATSAVEQTAAPGAGAPAQPPPPPAAQPEPGAVAAPSSGEDNDEARKKRDGLKEENQKSFTTVAEAEAALAQAKTELDTLLAPAGKAVALSSGDARCDKACKAFSSLRRAANGVCRLAGDDTPRCDKARGTVSDNEKRVATCGCAKDDD